jgi:hypothetical protein
MPNSNIVANFSHPSKDYSPIPIWWWSGERIERERLRWQLEQFAQGGVFNLIVLNLAPTSPLYGCDADDPPFLSEEWWQLFLGMCEDARALGVRIWFYDQLGFSGANFQGVVVAENSAYAGQWLESLTAEGDGAVELECPAEGIPLAAAMTPLDADGQPSGAPEPLPLDGRRIYAPGGRRQRVRLVYVVRRGFDYFSPAACARLLDKVHGEFERRAGHLFGQVIVGSFQDELPSLATWGSDFAAAFRAAKGYDITPHLPTLWDGADAAAERLRIDYHQVRASLAEEAFFKPLFHWHERHSLLCGFDQQGPARAGHPLASVHFYADYLQTHRWFTAPGSDHHGEAKIHSSLAHLYDRPRVWIESFHSSGWGGTLEETFDWLLPWLRAGANLYDPHAVYYSTRGGWWEWAPPSTCWRQPYWRYYSHFSQAVSRLCYLLSQGHHVCDVGVLFPTVAVQAGLTPEPQPLPIAQAAHDAYEQLLGSMFWQAMRPGILDQDRRDFDVLDDASLRRGVIEDGSLVIGAERYRTIILPACLVIDEGTAQRLCEFVEAGGLLIAIGAPPERTNAAASESIARLKEFFTGDRARLVARVDELPAALADAPRLVDAPVPTLRRRIDGQEVIFAPAAFPYATRQEANRSWLDVAYSFDPASYARNMKIVVNGVQGAPELWDPFDGSRRKLVATPHGDGVLVEVPFDRGPAALLVWPAAPTTETVEAMQRQPSQVIAELDDAWQSIIEPTLNNRYGDFDRPSYGGAPPVQTWRFAHRRETRKDEGLAAGWQLSHAASGDWDQVDVTFAVQGWWIGPQDAAALPPPLVGLRNGDDPLAVSGWQPLVYSLSRGAAADPLHRGTLGPKGHVPEEFMLFGPTQVGQAVQARTTIWLEKDEEIHLALAAPAAKRLWINGEEVGAAPSGYLWLAPVRLTAGANLIEFRLTAEQKGNLRAFWCLVRHPDRFARPEWMTAPDGSVRHSRLRFSCTLDLPFAPQNAVVQVGADAPCRVLVNGVEVGRQGGFDPYYATARVQPYRIADLQQGTNHLELEIQDLGGRVAVVVDGEAHGADDESFFWTSGSHWRVQRNDGPWAPVRLRRRQWPDSESDFFSDMDPAFSRLRRRPHPLPCAAWLEDAPADDTVLAVAPDPFAGRTDIEWLRWTLPSGAVEMELALQGTGRLWVDGVETPMEQGRARLPNPAGVRRVAVLRVEPLRGCSGGRLLAAPVSYTMTTGRILSGLWAEQGLESYSGGVRYRRPLTLDAAPDGALWLDLGRVRGAAEVWVNGRSAGVRIWSPYRFDVSELLQAGENTLEVLVLNTLAPYLDVQSPTFYVFPGQTDSGLLGPIRLLKG